MSQKILIMDFGGQYNQLIARRVRECNVYCEIKSYRMTVEEIKAYDPMGIIFTGGPNSVYLETSPHVDPAVFELGIPILGICYGCQLMAHTLGGLVTEAQEDSAREYGKTQTFFDTTCKLFKGIPAEGITWMSHGDYMAKVPEGFSLVGRTDACPNVKLICVMATGYDASDVEGSRKNGVPLCNVPSYGTHSVSQYAISLLLQYSSLE